MRAGECFAGKVAVLTGAASGMGLRTAERLAAAGAKVVMCDINAEALDAMAARIRAAGGTVETCVTDVRKFADAEKAAQLAIDRFGAIDLLIPFAGGNEARCCASRVPFYEQPREVLDWGLDVNLKGPVYFARACMPAMVRKGAGVICCLGSVTAFEGDGVGAMYGTAKSGLVSFVKSLALAGGPHGVRAVCVTPGPVLTRAAMSGMPTVLGRAAEPHELVDVILFLCSANASFVTGTNHVVDGGRLLMYQPYRAPEAR